jgi:hypothetical protein
VTVASPVVENTSPRASRTALRERGERAGVADAGFDPPTIEIAVERTALEG